MEQVDENESKSKPFILKWKTYLKGGGGRWMGEGVVANNENILGWIEKKIIVERIKFEN